MKDKDNVVHAFPSAGLPENLLEIERDDRAHLYCAHEKISMNHHNRTVLCAKCKATLDPFDFLLANAKTLHMAWYNYGVADRELKKLYDRIDLLKKEEKSLRGKVKRLDEKSGEFLNVRGDGWKSV